MIKCKNNNHLKNFRASLLIKKSTRKGCFKVKLKGTIKVLERKSIFSIKYEYHLGQINRVALFPYEILQQMRRINYFYDCIDLYFHETLLTILKQQLLRFLMRSTGSLTLKKF